MEALPNSWFLTCGLPAGYVCQTKRLLVDKEGSFLCASRRKEILLPLSFAFDNRDVSIQGRSEKRSTQTAGLWPFHFDPVNFLRAPSPSTMRGSWAER